MRETVAVIATVLNEAGAIEALLESLAGQTRRPDEVVIVDGGSRDGTAGRLAAWAATGRLPLRVIVQPGCNISQGATSPLPPRRPTSSWPPTPVCVWSRIGWRNAGPL
jgi:hypothetical protein